jgi:nucleotidyltransferase/DNA polymerase involved in DNA repair
MPYNFDLSALSVNEYKRLLKGQNLLPGRRVLLQDIDQNFEMIERKGIANIAQLKKQLGAPKKLISFAADTGIFEEYLVILKREMGSLEQKSVPIASFPGIDGMAVSNLNSKGIKTSKEYYESGMPRADELYCLCDLVRINGVGPVAAKAFYEAGYRSVAQVASADAAAMLEKVSKVNAAKQYYKAKLSAGDMQFCIDFAALLMKYCG